MHLFGLLEADNAGDRNIKAQCHGFFGNGKGFGKAMHDTTGVAGLLWHEGEIKLAKAARKAGIPFTLATGSNTPMEKVAQESGARAWFQLYMWRERELPVVVGDVA